MNKNNKPIVAVDPGVSGGFAVNTPDGIVLLSMPESLPEICALINQLKVANAELWIEELPLFVSPMTKSSSMATLHRNLGRVEAAAYAYGYALHRAAPKVWQAPLGLGGKASCKDHSEWKRKLKAKAQELYPHLDVTLKNCDALLILHYALGGGR